MSKFTRDSSNPVTSELGNRDEKSPANDINESEGRDSNPRKIGLQPIAVAAVPPPQ